MILVIADDFSGACELANIAVHQGFSATVVTETSLDFSTDVIAVDTNSRHEDRQSAVDRLAEILGHFPRNRFDWIYKKTDSVFRGNPIAEIETVMAHYGYHRCCFIPANPSRGRIIHEGKYLIDGVPLHHTEFGRDPRHPIDTNAVSKLVGNAPGIFVPDVTSISDLPCVSAEVLAAGAADFFSKLLGFSNSMPEFDAKARVRKLLVCGSLYAWHQDRANEMRGRHFHVVDLNHEFTADDLHADRLMLAIGEGGEAKSTQRMANLIGRVRQFLATHGEIHILAEGGDTARALVDSLAWSEFRVVRGRSNTVAHLRCPCDRYLLSVKPGSYDWPPEMF